MNSDLKVRVDEFVISKRNNKKVDVIISEWDQSIRQWPRSKKTTSTSSSIDTTSTTSITEQQQHLDELDFEEKASKLPENLENSTTYFEMMTRSTSSRRDLATNYNQNNNNTTRLLTNDCKTTATKHSRLCGPSGSVRGYRNFVRQSAQTLHELNELTINDQLIYVNSSSLLSRKILEQEDEDTPTTDDNGELELLLSEEELSSCMTPKVQVTLVKQAGKDNNNSTMNKQLISTDEIADRKKLALRALYLERLAMSERDRCVLYTTSLSVIRRTFDDSKLMRNILMLNLIRFEERDVYLNREYKIQLRLRVMMTTTTTTKTTSDTTGKQQENPPPPVNRLSSIPLSKHLPCLFVEGRLLCRLKDLELLNETSQMSQVFARFKMSAYASDICSCCGNARFIACPKCNGSRRSLVRHFRFSSVALRCTRCDKNDGLVACPACNYMTSFGARQLGQDSMDGQDESDMENNDDFINDITRS